jgi:hypothetical protein
MFSLGLKQPVCMINGRPKLRMANKPTSATSIAVATMALGEIAAPRLALPLPPLLELGTSEWEVRDTKLL